MDCKSEPARGRNSLKFTNRSLCLKNLSGTATFVKTEKYGNHNQNKKNKPAFKALILLASELEKNDHTAISISEGKKSKQKFDLILPLGKITDTFSLGRM